MAEITEQRDSAAATGGGTLGKGAWDCDTNTEIPPTKEARQRGARGAPSRRKRAAGGAPAARGDAARCRASCARYGQR